MLMGQNEGPLISVLMGVLYRRESLDLLERSIRSIQNQTYSNWELLICDDGSIEGARRYMEETAVQDARVHLVRGCPKADLASKLNWCLKAAKGTYIARMDDDDFSHPGRLSTQMKYLREHPQIAFVGCVAQLERDNVSVGMRQLPTTPVSQDFLFVQPFLHPTLLFRRKALETVGGYCEESRCIGCEDYDLLLRLYEKGLVGANIQNPLFTYTLPPLGSKKRTMALRWNEVKTRYVRFKSLGLLPGSFPYVIKPVVIRMIPGTLLEGLKQIRNRRMP